MLSRWLGALKPRARCSGGWRLNSRRRICGAAGAPSAGAGMGRWRGGWVHPHMHLVAPRPFLFFAGAAYC